MSAETVVLRRILRALDAAAVMLASATREDQVRLREIVRILLAELEPLRRKIPPRKP